MWLSSDFFILVSLCVWFLMILCVSCGSVMFLVCMLC